MTEPIQTAIRPKYSGTIVLNSADGIATTDIRNVTFTFTHDALFRGLGSMSEMHKYAGFRIAMNSMAIKNSATAPVATTNALMNVCMIPSQNALVSGFSDGVARNFNVLARFALNTLANGFSLFYSTYTSDYILPMSTDGQYSFNIILSTGVSSSDIRTATGYLPAGWSLSLSIELIPK